MVVVARFDGQLGWQVRAVIESAACTASNPTGGNAKVTPAAR